MVKQDFKKISPQLLNVLEILLNSGLFQRKDFVGFFQTLNGFQLHFFLQTSALGEEHKSCVLTVFGAACTYQKPTEQSPSLSQFTKATE